MVTLVPFLFYVFYMFWSWMIFKNFIKGVLQKTRGGVANLIELVLTNKSPRLVMHVLETAINLGGFNTYQCVLDALQSVVILLVSILGCGKMYA